VGVIWMANEILAKTQKLMQGMNGNPRNNLKISRQALRLLEQVPNGGSTYEEVARNLPLKREAAKIALELRQPVAEATSKLYKKPGQYGEGVALMKEITQFARKRTPLPESIH
jgi:hypothetical protein